MRIPYQFWLQSILLALLLSFIQSSVKAETIDLAPVGEYAKIDVKLAEQSMHDLQKGTSEEKEKRIQAVINSPSKYIPVIFYVLSNQLFAQGKKDEAAFWFYAGQLRARYDANRCADVSAREAVAVLNQQYGRPINQYTFQHVDMLEILIPKVVEWDRLTPHDYDQRWINLHGMGAVQASLGDSDKKGAAPTMSLPKAEWETIAEKTRKEYLQGFSEAMVEAKKRKQP